MAKVRLTSNFCLLAQCEPGRKRTDYWDESVSGFVLEVHPTGRKTYALRYIDAYKKQRQVKIGTYGDITFDQAKKKAKELRSNITLGGDPAAIKSEKRAIPIYMAVADLYLERAEKTQKSYSTTAGYMYGHILPRWGKVRLSDITPHDISLWLLNKKEEGLAPATVEKIRAIFSRSFTLAMKLELQGVTVNPVVTVPHEKFHNARERFLTAEEAKRLITALDASANKQLKSIILLLLLTGARRNELLYAKWEQIDLDRRSWHIPTSKTGKPRYVPLSQQAVDIIKGLRRFKGCPWLLPNPRTQQPYTCIKHPWDTARKAAGLADVRIHDLRHSAASFMINAGVDLFAVGRVLGHADHKSTMRYAHLADETLLKAVEKGAAKMNATCL